MRVKHRIARLALRLATISEFNHDEQRARSLSTEGKINNHFRTQLCGVIRVIVSTRIVSVM